MKNEDNLCKTWIWNICMKNGLSANIFLIRYTLFSTLLCLFMLGIKMSKNLFKHIINAISHYIIKLEYEYFYAYHDFEYYIKSLMLIVMLT